MCILYRYQKQEYATASQRKAKRHIRGLITSFIILGLFAVLWLPSCIMDAYSILRISTGASVHDNKLNEQVFWYLYALVILNTICDPVVYAMRMREIQSSLKVLLCFKRKSSQKTSVLKHNSSGSMPLKYVQRQFSNSTNMTVSSAGTLPMSMSTNSTIQQERQSHSRKGTITSHAANDSIDEETPLQNDPSCHSQLDNDDTSVC